MATLLGADHWIRIRSGPFEVMTSAGENDARQTMFDAEEFRSAVESLIGKQDSTTVWPIRIIVVKNARDGAALPGTIAMGRDSWMSVAVAGQPLSSAWKIACARILIDNNTGRIPTGIENGMIVLLSTLGIDGTHLTIGTPPPPAERTRDWARMHLLATRPEYRMGMRILLSNLTNGGDYEAACHNAFGKTAAEMDKRVDQYFAAGQFEAVPFPGRALSDRDFTVRDVEAYDGQIAMADLLLADPAKQAEAKRAYSALAGAEAQEGIALLALRNKATDAPNLFEAATKAGSTNPRAWLGTGTNAGAIKAIELNPRWADPHIRLAELGTAPNVTAAELGKAAALEPRNSALWQRAALAYEAANEFTEAGKAWSRAELAAGTPADKKRIRDAHVENEKKRADFAAAERKRIADEQAAELERIKSAEMAEIKAAEEKANREMAKNGPMPSKVEQWWDGPNGPAQTVSGTLTRIDCLGGGRSRWIVETAPKKSVALLVEDPSKIVISGSGEVQVGCGPQRPARKLTVEYSPVRDAKLKTAGQVQTVEFK